MKIIISPAKRMKEDSDAMPVLGTAPFSKKTDRLKRYLRQLSLSELQALLQCNEHLAEENYRRYQSMDRAKPATPAIFAYQGIQYQSMAPTAFTEEQYRYIQEHLCILSGLYGVLRPFDGVTPYRLEMQAKLQTPFCRDLYDFWNGVRGIQPCSPAGNFAVGTVDQAAVRPDSERKISGSRDPGKNGPRRYGAGYGGTECADAGGADPVFRPRLSFLSGTVKGGSAGVCAGRMRIKCKF